MRYDPDIPPDPVAWLALDDAEREEAVLAWHDAHDEPELHVDRHPPDLHATLHALVESQIAREDPPVVSRTVARLAAEGMRRHAALHAVMALLVRDIVAFARGDDDTDRYRSQVAALDAADVIASSMRRGLDPSDDPDPAEGPDAPQANRAERRAAARRDRKSTKRR